MSTSARKDGTFSAALLAGFTATAAMWAAGYVARLPGIGAPSSLLFWVFVLFLLGGGILAGRETGRTLAGLEAGLVSAAVNLLVLGAILSPAERAKAWLFVPGFFVLAAVVGAIGGFIGSRSPAIPESPNREGRFARVAVLVTLLLVIAGGVVTTKGAGMAVPDWPTTEGFSPVLFPLSKMTGGVYFEHAHRMVGTLVGLTVLVLMIWTLVAEKRRWVKGVAVLAFVLVAIQGTLGGLRVTDVSQTLAAIHGVVGQAIFALLVAIAAFTSRTFRESPLPAPSPRIGFDRNLGRVLLVVLLVQIGIGAVLRHYDELLNLHMTVAVIVFVVAVIAGFRAWGLYPEFRVLRRAGALLLVLTVAQLTLGIAALVARNAPDAARGAVATLVITAHQATGALLLGTTTVHLVFTHRLLRPAGEPEPAE